MSNDGGEPDKTGEGKTGEDAAPNHIPTRIGSIEDSDNLDFSQTEQSEATRPTTVFSASGDERRHPESLPVRDWVGRYRVERILGKGGFGLVYLAYDGELRRRVTIKIPHAHRLTDEKDVEAFLDEARMLAKLEHPNVVPVHDVGRTEEGTCFIVSRFIDGSDLFKRSKEAPLQLPQALELVATIAEALHYVHSMRVIHRDIKPNNILLDKRGTAYLADFGLALLEEDAARTSRVAGTPAYMSPEQARGENHLVTSSSDIFSLGVVLYELITGRKPFSAKNAFSVLRMIQEDEAQNPTELNPEISPELERVCLKSLSKRANARHATALDLANDLRFLLNPSPPSAFPAPPASRLEIAKSAGGRSEEQSRGLVPRGLRSFGSQDAHFFNDLLPGPYNRDGTPESILFWKRRIEERDPESTFRVGLIYGPSGCGKSSFCKAGLLPMLKPDVHAVFVEAAPTATETRLLNRLRRTCPYLDTELDLRESIAVLRHKNLMGEGSKVLLIIDQFEQWLYSTPSPEHSDLAKALRQCDGEHVQCILLVRDDFWLAFSRFMEHVEIDLLQNHNMSMIDLFDIDHAKLVLREFGQAFERLPRDPSDISRDERAFIDQAIDGLAEQGKVIPVRIALFAEMIKSRPWTPSTLRQIGGTQGVGVLFLEQNFSSTNAPAEFRVHLDAVFKTLGALLPVPGTNLKGHMRSHAELLSISGYEDQPKQFSSLIRTLDNELHLITRTTPSGRADISASQSGSFSASQSSEIVQGEYYQLAHDYLVPAIREWQLRMQRGTRRGRAEMRLAQRAEVWKARPESRHLPTIVEWLSILALTHKKRWDETERLMMRSADRRHGLSLFTVGLLLIFSLVGSWQFLKWNRSNTLVRQLEVAEAGELNSLLGEVERIGVDAEELLEAMREENQPGTTKHLFSSLALLRLHSDQADSSKEILERIRPSFLTSNPETLGILCDELASHHADLANYLWGEVEDESLERSTNETGRSFHPRLNALLALATLDPPPLQPRKAIPEKQDQWEKHADFFANELIHFANTDRSNFSFLVDRARPATDILLKPLAEEMTNSTDDEGILRQSAAQDLLVRLLEKRIPDYVDILLDADVDLILDSLELVDRNFRDVRPVLENAVETSVSLSDKDWTQVALRRATAAALLLRHQAATPAVWSVLKPSKAGKQATVLDDSRDILLKELTRLLPTQQSVPLLERNEPSELLARYREVSYGRRAIPNARTRLVQRVREFGAIPEPIARKLIIETDLTLQCGLLQALGEFDAEQIPPSLRDQVITLSKGWLLSASSAQLRGNAFWFLCRWNEEEWARQQIGLPSPLRPEDANWYVNSIGQTMIRLPQHVADDSYRIEIAAGETTLGQLKKWQSDGKEKYNWSATSDDLPAGHVTYNECVAFCNWLSRSEGLSEDQLCYPDRRDPRDPPVRIYEDYQNRSGYRLPMAEEWFFACSGGAITDYSFGSSREGPGPVRRRLFDGYVHSVKGGAVASWPHGIARPNDFGIFEMYSNVREWANDIDPKDATRVQLCGFDFRIHLGVQGIEPRYLGWSEPSSSRSFYGMRLFRSQPQTLSNQNSNGTEANVQTK